MFLIICNVKGVLKMFKISYILLLLSVLVVYSVAKAECRFWDVGGGFKVDQDNDYHPIFYLDQDQDGTIHGSAEYTHGPGPTYGTVVDGSNISGSEFHVVVQWDEKTINTRGAYDGFFNNNGELSGRTCDVFHPSSCTNWSVKNRRFACLKP
jgi:hypothetical protein